MVKAYQYTTLTSVQVGVGCVLKIELVFIKVASFALMFMSNLVSGFTPVSSCWTVS